MQQSNAVRVVEGVYPRWLSGTRFEKGARWWMLYPTSRMVSDLSHCLGELEGTKRKKVRGDKAIVQHRRRFGQQTLAHDFAQQYFPGLSIMPK